LAEVGSWQQSLLIALVCTLGVRLFLTVYMAGISILFPEPGLAEQYGAVGVPILDSGLEGALLGVWQREDALWYEKIATSGYGSGDMSVGYFPLYPALMGLLARATSIPVVAAGILVSELALVAALFLLHRLLIPRFGIETANRTLVYLSLFPSAFFLHGPFAESLMLMLAILGFWLVSRGRLVEAMVVAYLGGLTRPQGILLGLPLALEWLFDDSSLLQLRSALWHRKALLKGLALLLAPLLGLLTFGLLVDTHWLRPGFSGAEGPMSRQSLAIPGAALVNAAQLILAGRAFPIDLYDFTLAVGFLVLAVATTFKQKVSYVAYAFLFLMTPLARYSPIFPLMSFSRYALLLFPCFVVLACWGRRKWVHLTVIFLWLWWLAVWSAKFYTGYFVG